ncbi:MAG TPA: hypothetical protein V6D18_15175 [Thermosynechococcaceae cyanobacterium]
MLVHSEVTGSILTIALPSQGDRVSRSNLQEASDCGGQTMVVKLRWLK